MISVTPRGFKDVLPEEARIREELRGRAISAMDLWGYDPIETPTLEVLSVLEERSKLASATFKLFDGDNNLLVLRPDITLPIARMVASRLTDDDKTLRFRYDLSVFRDNDPSKGSSREFTQLGIEQIGLSGVDADAETIIVFIESLLASGLQEFKINFCNVEVLNKLLKACNMGAEFDASVRKAFHTSNYVKLDQAVDTSSIEPKIAACIKDLIRMHGGREAIAQCAQMLGGLVRSEVFDQLLATWDIVEACGYGQYIEIDFSLLSDFDYYTGLIMEAFAPGFGKSIGGGGRYDNLLGAFGKSMPAAGFAFSLERLMHALSVQGNLVGQTKDKQVIKASGADAFKQAMQLHSQGKTAMVGGVE